MSSHVISPPLISFRQLEAHEETIATMHATHARERAAWASSDSYPGASETNAIAGLKRWLQHDRHLSLRRSLQRWRLSSNTEGYSTAQEGLVQSLIEQHAECEALKLQHQEDVANRNR